MLKCSKCWGVEVQARNRIGNRHSQTLALALLELLLFHSAHLLSTCVHAHVYVCVYVCRYVSVVNEKWENDENTWWFREIRFLLLFTAMLHADKWIFSMKMWVHVACPNIYWANSRAYVLMHVCVCVCPLSWTRRPIVARRRNVEIPDKQMTRFESLPLKVHSLNTLGAWTIYTIFSIHICVS